MPYIGSSPPATALTSSDIADSIITEAKMADDAISLTELKAGTDGEIISWDASGNPVAIAVGTSGHFLKSQGAGSQPVFAAAGGGKLGQFVHTVLTANDQSSSTTDSWIDVTNLSVAITPSATNSVIIVDYQLATGNGDKSYWGWSKVSRDINSAGYGDWNYNVGDNTGATSTVEVSGGARNEPYSDHMLSVTGARLKDSTHNTTSQITYKVQFWNSNGGTVKINRSSSTANADTLGRSISWISALEILA